MPTSRGESLQTLAPLVERAPVAALFVQRDAAGELVLAAHNAAAVALDADLALRLGRRRSELDGWSAELLARAEYVWGDEVAVHTFTPRAAQGGDGRTLRATLLEPAPGLVLAWVEDVTAADVRHAQAHEAQQLMAVGRRAAELAAELEDLFATIGGAASGAAVLSTDPAVREELETIRASAQRASALAQALVAAPPASEPLLFEFALDDIAAGLEAQLSAALPPGLRARVAGYASDWRACLDAGDLQRFLVELGRAAGAARPREGALVYALDALHVGPGGLPEDPAAASGEFLRIRLWDEGPGGAGAIAACGFDALFHAGPEAMSTGGDALAIANGYARIRQVGGHARTTTDDAGRAALAVYLPRAPRLGPATLPPLEAATLLPDSVPPDGPATERPARPDSGAYTRPVTGSFTRPDTGSYTRPESVERPTLAPRPSLLPRASRLPPRASMFPRASRPPGASRPSQPPAAALRRAERVLVAEDEPLVRNVVVRTLRAAGYDVVAAVSGDAALALALADPTGFDLLVSDVQMPGLDGQRLAQALRERQPTLSVLFMSGYSDAAYEGAPLTQGASFVAKPFTARELAAAARRAIDG